MLLELPVPFRRTSEAKLLVESQALNGLLRWSEHFQPITVCAPVIPERHIDSSIQWEDPSNVSFTGEVALVPLPWGYHPADYLRTKRPVEKVFRNLIPRHRYLCFSNIGPIGSWGNLASSIAWEMKRPYSLWFDSVIHEMDRSDTRTVKKLIQRAYCRHQTFSAIRRSTLGLFHGKTVYDAYAPYAQTSALVHDVHVKPDDAISDARLREKLRSQREPRALRIGYAGRVEGIKGPFDWIDAVVKAIKTEGEGALEATWYGSGSLLEASQERVARLKAERWIKFPGLIKSRPALLDALRQLDLFVFCHTTPESPRCLIEALISGTPLVGYDSAYARDLVGARGGASLVPIGDIDGLADRIASLSRNRESLAALTGQASETRSIYNDAAVFAHRSELMKKHLP